MGTFVCLGYQHSPVPCIPPLLVQVKFVKYQKIKLTLNCLKQIFYFSIVFKWLVVQIFKVDLTGKHTIQHTIFLSCVQCASELVIEAISGH